jgi:glycosyltransferase involved in cell wall biosynthesis
MDIVLDPLRHQVSIVVPVLNEAATISSVLKQLTALDMRQQFEISKEIIVVDGGSADGTYEAARAFDGVTTLRLPKGSGRGAAMRTGVEHARGDIIVFFPGDLEYKVEDICRTVAYVLHGDYKAVFGTRNVKVADFSARLAGIYGNARGLYLMSKYGGMLLSMATLFLYNRYVSDPLTCLMAFDAALIRSLGLESEGLGIHTEIVARLCRRNEYILEIPVDYTPRKRAAGKKTTPLDGFQAMLPLIRHKRAGSTQ